VTVNRGPEGPRYMHDLAADGCRHVDVSRSMGFKKRCDAGRSRRKSCGASRDTEVSQIARCASRPAATARTPTRRAESRWDRLRCSRCVCGRTPSSAHRRNLAWPPKR